MAVIELEHFSKAYGNFLAVDDISISIEKGEIVGFVGKNGKKHHDTFDGQYDFSDKR